jgi:hypothetical protein
LHSAIACFILVKRLFVHDGGFGAVGIQCNLTFMYNEQRVLYYTI